MKKFVLGAVLAASLTVVCQARDDGRYANSPLKSWFESLRSQRGLCCSFADGVTVENVDWDNEGQDDQVNSRYRVRVTKDWPADMQSFVGQWISIPKSALMEQPNRAGVAIVWPYIDNYGSGNSGRLQIRCFLPGAGT